MLAASLLSASPALHEHLHHDTTATHLCLVTLFASGHCAASGPLPVFPAPDALPPLGVLPSLGCSLLLQGAFLLAPRARAAFARLTIGSAAALCAAASPGVRSARRRVQYAPNASVRKGEPSGSSAGTSTEKFILKKSLIAAALVWTQAAVFAEQPSPTPTPNDVEVLRQQVEALTETVKTLQQQLKDQQETLTKMNAGSSRRAGERERRSDPRAGCKRYAGLSDDR